MLDSEKLDMHLDPAAKQANLLNIAIPVNVRGTLANPNVLPDPTALAKNATGALTGLVTGNSAAPPSRPALPAAAEARQREPRQRRSSSRPSRPRRPTSCCHKARRRARKKSARP